ncbi:MULTISPECIES: amino acid adenylation domain-containing protein [unclassified Microcoleus]|uniref:amino acid adenylation domain-containing protein n=1 Tax=unclassified Microcoleus TaxID=2642155 RepID=UPI002FD30B88
MNKQLFESHKNFTPVEFDPFVGGELVGCISATEAQKEIWISAQMEDDANCAYNESMSLRLVGNIDLEALRYSIQELVARHEALRLTFSPNGTILCIAASCEIDIPLIDLSMMSDSPTQFAQLQQQEVGQSFDLVRGPLFRAKIVKLQGQEYIVMLTAHHIICDGWSWGVLLPDLGVLYSARKQGVVANLSESILFSEYAFLQEQEADSSEMKADEAYWLKQFSSSPPILDLPTDRPRPPLRTYKAAREDWPLDAALVKNLKRLGAKSGCSFLTTMLAAFEILLSDLCGQDDLVVGMPAAGQSVSGCTQLVGHCVSLLPLRTHIEREKSFIDYLRNRRSLVLDAYEHQKISFGSLLKTLTLPRDSSRIPLVSVVFNLDMGLKSEQLTFDGLQVEYFSNPRSSENFELFINALESGGKLVLECQYNTTLFDAETVRRHLAEFEQLLLSIVADPTQPLWQLALLPAAEQQLLATWNNTQKPYPENQCLHQLFEAQVERTPEAVALVFGTGRLTYRELNTKANQLAHYLQKLGVGPDVLVGICLERSLDLIVALFGILKAGGAYVPLDPAYPQERIEFMLSDAQVAVLLTQEKLLAELPKSDAHPVCLDKDGNAIADQKSENPIDHCSPANLVYILYTSGSTGRPKGVAIEHHSPVALVDWAQTVFTPEQLSGVLASTSICFDLSVFEIFLPLSCGGKVILAENALHLPTLPAAGEVTLINTVPTAIAELLKMGIPKQVNTVNLAGEPLSNQLAQQLYQQNIQYVFNLYGPSEDTTYSTYALVEIGTNKSPAIGKPIANTQIYILDSHLQQVPIGSSGEIYISGAGLARCYLNRPDLTAEKFIPNPIGEKFHTTNRVYKTGDLGRYLPDGNIEYIGRIDNQVKIRGFRIELGEIEAVLADQQLVKTVAVIAREDRPGDRRLVAYLVLNQTNVNTEQKQALVQSWRNGIQHKLPEYMMPAAFVILESMPLTPNGKVDRRALPAAPSTLETETESSFVAPSNSVEEAIASIWCEVMGIERIGIHQNFFELGGHSLMAGQIVFRLGNQLSVDLSLRTLFLAPTIAGLATEVSKQLRGSDSEETSSPLPSVVRRQEFPLSFAQQRMWFLHQLDPESGLYNIPIALYLVGPLQIATLEQSLMEIVRRHESLRTTFPSVDGDPVQLIAPTLTVTLSVIDLQALPIVKQDAEVQRLALAEANYTFDLTQLPLVRSTLLQLGPESHVLLVTFHHIVFDGWSIGVLMQELSTLYIAWSTGQPSPLPELPLQYADFACWQRQWATESVMETQLRYWKQQLSGCPALLQLPTDRPRPSVQRFRGRTELFQVNPEVAGRLNILSQQSGATLFMTLLAVFAILLSRYSGQENIVIGSPIANRTRGDIESLIGFFVNTLALRIDVSGNPTFAELIERVRDVALDAYTYQDLPFDRVVAQLQPDRNASYHPLFQVMFVLQNAPTEQLQLPGVVVTALEIETVTSKFDLLLSLEEGAAGLKGLLEYNTDLFDTPTMTRMVGHFQILLEALATNPRRRISELPLLSAAEQQQLLVDWNHTHTNYPQDACIHELFEAQAEQTPDAVALVFGEQQLTYQQLNSRANQLAHYLQTLGAGPEVLIGVCFDRSLDAIVSLLAVLKAGSAYLPLDPAYPQDRLEFMLSDAALSVLLTQQHLTEKLPDTEAKIVCLEQVREEINAQSEDNLAHLAQAENLAYVMYTSGSTGKPKGVCVVHRGVVRLVKNTDYASFSAAEVFLQLAPISFDASTLEIWGALLNGAQLVVFPPGTPSLAELGEAIGLYKVTILWLTAGLFHLMVDERIEDLKGLRLLLAGGDVLSVPHVQKLLREAPNCQLINGYGPTENTTFTCCFAIARDSQISNSVPIGRPIANTQVYILDRHLQPVPIGVPGELYAGGAGLARGYLNRPDLTAERFIPNPLIANQEDGWKNAEGRSVSSLLPSANHLYKTGDLARYLPDGNIEYLGRIDNQVKIRGFRIEIGEIEAVLAGHLDVSQVSVAVQLDASGNKCLAAYVVPGPGKILAANTLRSFLQKRLPDYMIPAGFVFLDALPLNPNGKVDRHALASQKWQSASVAPDQTIAVAPRDKLELQVKQIWEQVLGINSVGIRDNFFEIGGHSLLAARLLAEIEKVFDKKLPLSAIFQSPTVEQLADILREPEWSSPSPSMVMIQPGTGSYKPPLFCIHVLGRGLEFYRPLLNYIDQSQPVLGLSTQIMDEKLAPPNRVEELAAYYIKEMQVFQPHGPYFLLGVSFGGTVAFEIARQLHAKGEKVALLGLLDTYGPDAFKNLPQVKRGQRAMKVLHMTPGVFLRKTQSNLAGKVESITNQIWRISSKFYQAIGRPLPIELENFTHRELNEEALRHYVAGVYSGGATIFKAVESAILFDADTALGWGEVVTGGIEIHEIPSDHLGMLQEPHVRILAEKLQAAVDRARQMNCQ